MFFLKWRIYIHQKQQNESKKTGSDGRGYLHAAHTVCLSLINRVCAKLLQIMEMIQRQSSSKIDTSLEQTLHKRGNEDGQSTYGKEKLEDAVHRLAPRSCLTRPGDAGDAGAPGLGLPARPPWKDVRVQHANIRRSASLKTQPFHSQVRFWKT